MANRRRSHSCQQERRERAEVRAEERANRTPQQQLKILDDKFGVGVGATRERQRLQQMIDDK